MYTDSITLEFILIFVSILLVVIFFFPVLDYINYWRAKRRNDYKAEGNGKAQG